jgi:hypothetical protein
MFPAFCGAIGVAGWVVMLLVWTAAVGLAVWGITRLFPDRTGPTPPALPPRHHVEPPPRQPDVEPPLTESVRR